MKNTSILFFLVLFLANCSKNEAPSHSYKHNWKSKYHPVSVNYTNEWKLIASPDEFKKLTGFELIIEPESLLYSIKVSPGSSIDQKKYHEEICDHYKDLTSAFDNTQLIHEDRVQKFGTEYCRMISVQDDPNLGKMLQHLLVGRYDDQIMELFLHFPYSTELQLQNTVPDKILELEKGIKIF